MKPTRERGRPARTTLAKPRPSPRPGSTGKDARALLGLSPCGSHRQGGRVRHRRETERQPRGEDAGGTPALPGGLLSSRLPFKGESAQTNWLDGRLESQFDNPLVSFVSLRGSLFFFCLFSFVSDKHQPRCSLMKRSTWLREGMEACAPGRVTERAAAALAKSMAWGSERSLGQTDGQGSVEGISGGGGVGGLHGIGGEMAAQVSVDHPGALVSQLENHRGRS